MPSSRRTFIKTTGAALALLGIKHKALATAAERTGIKDFYRDDFRIGTALKTAHLLNNNSAELALAAREFNAITAENCMKWERIKPHNHAWNWEAADKFVAFGEQHKMYIVGHNLVWHSQVPQEIFQDAQGRAPSTEQLTHTMHAHIAALVGRYRGRIHAWDVVNEAVDDNGSWRASPWYKIMGENFIAQAFQMAHAADPKAHLIYNDFNTEIPHKRDFIMAMIKKYKHQGAPIHGIGLQAHVSLEGPSLLEIETTLMRAADIGVRVHITELDIDVLPSVWNAPTADLATRFEYKPELDPYRQGLPKNIAEQLAKRYEDIFKIYIKHRDKIERVTLWGSGDGETWLNNFPIHGRTNYPLLFDRKLQPKPAYFRLLDLKK
jgi:endo-1,4-beta-xylanase